MTVRRCKSNPILTREDIPDLPPHICDVSSVFNPGAATYGDVDLLMLRVQNRARETFLMMADSRGGHRFAVRSEVVEWQGIERVGGTIYHIYDPRITRIGSEYVIVFALDVDDGCRLGVGRTNDFEEFEFLGVGEGDVRNGVLFPERMGGKYLRLDRPNRLRSSGTAATGDEIWLSESTDLIEWKPLGPVMRGRPRFWDELIGSGTPPIKTTEGWLHIYHGVATHFHSVNIYQAGVVLLDLNDPMHVVARGRQNILEPRETYELVGQVPNVVFPSGAIVRGDEASGVAKHDCTVDLYYGAADTCVALATTTVGELLAACHD